LFVELIFRVKSTGGKTRIERAANRDPVVDQVRATNALKCTFSDVVEIAPKLFLDSGISRVECPDCKASRSLELRNEVLRFPSHDKRKPRTPQTDLRWALSETVWKVVER
jgi:predicted patatin/cPLA2 family phospholipase